MLVECNVLNILKTWQQLYWNEHKYYCKSNFQTVFMLY